MKKFIINVGYKKNLVRTYNVECEDTIDAMIMAEAISKVEGISYASMKDLETGEHTMHMDV